MALDVYGAARYARDRLATRFHFVRVRSWRLHDSTRDGEGLIISPMRPEGDGCLMAGWFKAWAERRRDDAPSQSFGATSAQGGLKLGEDVGDVGFV